VTIPTQFSKNPPTQAFEPISSPYQILATQAVINSNEVEIGSIQIHADGSSYFKIPSEDGFKFMKLRIRSCAVQDQFYLSLSPAVKYLRSISDQMFLDELGVVGKAELFNETRNENLREMTLIA
jgi:hypothetical protein